MSAPVAPNADQADLDADGAGAPMLADAARDAVERSGGSMVIDAAPVDLKREVDVFGPLRADFAIMRRLKEQFDPGRTLSPGRFAGRL